MKRIHHYSLILAALALLLPAPAAAQRADDFFDPSVLHEIRIDINPSDWDTLKRNFRDNTYYNADFRWKYGNRYVESPDIAIRSRGRGSRSPIKPGLRIDFNRNDSSQTFLGLTQVVLRNNSQDPSQLHERVSMLLFQLMGLVPSREAHVRFYVNDQYAGLYTIVESVDRNYLRRRFNQDNGYLYEYDYQDDYNFEYKGSNPALYSPLPFRPETHERDPNPAPIEAMIRTMNQASDADFPRAISEFLDMNKVMIHLATENYLGDEDGILGDFGMNNFYIYRFENTNLSQLLAWDKSQAFRGPDYDIFRHFDRNVLARRAAQVPEFRNAYLRALARAAVASGAEGGWLQQEIEREYQQIRSSALEDPFKQCQGSDGLPRPCTNEEFEAGVAAMRSFAVARFNRIFSQLPGAGLETRVVNAASFVAGDIAPGSLISIFGQNMAGGTAQATALPLPTELGGVSVRINGVASPLLFVSPGQINLQIPWQTQPGNLQIVTVRDGAASAPMNVTVQRAAPGIFVTVHANNQLVTAENPAVAGEVLVVYSTGLGTVSNTPQSGQGAPTSPLAMTNDTPSVTIGDIPARVEFSGLTPGFVGLYQVNVTVPAGVAPGPRVPLLISVNGQPAVPALIAVR